MLVELLKVQWKKKRVIKMCVRKNFKGGRWPHEYE